MQIWSGYGLLQAALGYGKTGSEAVLHAVAVRRLPALDARHPRYRLQFVHLREQPFVVANFALARSLRPQHEAHVQFRQQPNVWIIRRQAVLQAPPALVPCGLAILLNIAGTNHLNSVLGSMKGMI